MRIIMALCIAMMLAGCASTQMATSIGIDVGTSFQKAAAKGEISAEQTIKAWPYVSGLIRGLLAEDYDYKVSGSAQFLMDELDSLAAKTEPLTSEDKGMVIGYMVRLEYIAVKEFWERYGISMYGAIKAFMAGG